MYYTGNRLFILYILFICNTAIISVRHFKISPCLIVKATWLLDKDIIK